MKQELQRSPENAELATASLFAGDDVVKLSKALGACLLVQRTYGKQGSDIEKITNVFLKILSGFEPERVIDAVKEWVETSSEFPTPADILQILNPKPKFEYAVYQRLAHKAKVDGVSMTSDEWSYLRGYERLVISG